jgi:riboflavin biosynthesis pyrimidine reductase
LKLVRLNPIGPPLELSEGELRDFLAAFDRESALADDLWTLNLVCTLDGETVGATGSSRDLTNPADYAALMGLRDASDYILTSAKTARIERYRLSTTPLVLVSRSGDFAGIPALEQLAATERKGGLYLVGPTVGFSPEFRANLAGTFANLAEFAHFARGRRVAVEAGPELASVLIGLGLIRRLAVSVVGVSAGINPGAQSTAETISPAQAVIAMFARLGVASAHEIFAALVPGFDTLLTQWKIQSLVC